MPESLIQLAGRLHPVVLHVPIGTLAALLALELAWLLRRAQPARDVRVTLCLLLVGSCACAAGTGWLLADESGYAGNTVRLHRWLGVAFACSVSLPLVACLLGRHRAYAWSLLGAALLGTIGGHFGGTITHGRGFLTAPFRTPTQPRTAPNPEPADAAAPVVVVPTAGAGPRYSADIAPIFDRVCVACHGADKQKGGLMMDTPEGLLLGGDTGDAFVPGDAESSEIVFRMRLPAWDEAHMPPEDKPQPTDDEIAKIVRWIESGGSFD